jgi:hypothetical protein
MFEWLWRPFYNLLLKLGITNLQCGDSGNGEDGGGNGGGGNGGD